jgi:LmbE family N-acetylglucosaminyl deacetylase
MTIIRRLHLLLFLFVTFIAVAQPPRSYTSSEILLQLKKLNTVGSVLYIAAHPDDENTRLIAYLANEKCLRTGYLSLTRGDGGQNLIGPEQGIELGVIRTQELLAARRIDGGEQFFTRAYDFGFSKSHEETLTKWNKDSILSDMVWIIRKFRPDIIITRFSTDGSGGHGHHTASAILVEEAFDAAGDPSRFPEQLQYVEAWKPRRLLYNATNRFRDPNADMSAFIKLDVGGYNPLLGKSYGEISAESRSMHKSQGFGSAKQRGEYFEYFKPIKGDTAGLRDIFEGMDFSWNRLKGNESTGKHIQKIIDQFKTQNPEASLPELVRLRNQLSQPFEQYITEQAVKNKFKDITTFIQHGDKQFFYQKNKLQLLDEIIAAAAGIVFDATSQASNTASGDKQNVTLSVFSRLTNMVTLTSISYGHENDSTTLLKLETNKAYSFSRNVNIPDDKPIGELYWLSQKRIHEGLFNIPLAQIGMPENNFYPDKASISLIINNTPLRLYRNIQYKWVEPDKGELYRPQVVTPPILIKPESYLLVFADDQPKELKVKIIAGKDSLEGLVRILLPEGWDIRLKGTTFPKNMTRGETGITFSINKKSKVLEHTFMVYPLSNANEKSFTFTAEDKYKIYTKGIKEIKYDHIPIQTLFPEAEVKLVKLDVVKKSKRIGYIPGAGDEVQACLSQLGYEVTTLTDDKLASENLSSYDAIITGVRAYNTNEKLLAFKQKLMDYVANGGNLIVQYNTNSWAGPLNSDIGPYKFKITRNRITDEEAKVNFLLPNHPVLNTPNKITDKDFEGWIQERSIYHAGEWDSNFVAPISMSDPYEMTVGGVSPKGKTDNGALIIAKHGKGNFVYTGLVFFRQLPAGVPGAYRFLVNMIELGK